MAYTFLFEVSPVKPDGSITTLHLSSREASTKSVYLDGKQWLPLIETPPDFEFNLMSSGQLQFADVSYGNIEFICSEVYGNEVWSSYDWTNALGRCWYGEDGADFSDFNQVFEGKVSGFNRSDIYAKVALLGSEADIQVPALNREYTGVGGIEGTSAVKGNLKPRAHGHCINIEPLPIDLVYWVFQVHGYGPVEDIPAVYEYGQALAPSSGDVATYQELIDLELEPGEWATCKAHGLFRLGGAPNKKLTCDVKGAKNAGVYGSTAKQIIQSLIKEVQPSAQFGTFPACFDVPWCFYSDAEVSVRDIVYRAAYEVGGYLYPNGMGVWCAGDFYSPVNRGSLRSDRSTLPTVLSYEEKPVTGPIWKVSVGYDHVWSPHSPQDLSPAIYDDIAADAQAARDAAEAAQDAAEAAEAQAQQAMDRLEAISSDNILDRSDKWITIKEYEAIQGEAPGITDQANLYGITSELLAYTAARTALSNYLTGLSPAYNDTTQDTIIVGTEYRQKFNNVYAARQTLLNRIATIGNLSAYLTNPSHMVLADSEGNVESFNGAGGSFIVKDGKNPVTQGVTYSVVSSSGLTITINAQGVYQVSGMSANSGTAVLRAVYDGQTFDYVFSLAKALQGAQGQPGADGSIGVDGKPAISGYLTNDAINLWAYADGTVSSYSGAAGTFKVSSGNNDVTGLFTLSTVANPQNLTVGYVDQTYTISGGFDASEDTASLTIRATGTGAFAGVTLDKTVSLSKTKGGYEIVSSLPTTNNFMGRYVYLTTDEKLYRYTSTGWTAAVKATDIDGQLLASQIANSSITTAKFAQSIEPVTIVSSVPSTKSTATIYNTANGKTYRWDGTKYTTAVPSQDISGQLTSNQIASLEAAKVAGQLTDAQLADISAAKITGQLVASQIANNAVTATKFASDIEPVTNVTSVPATKSTNTIYNATDKKLYRWDGTKYVATIPAADLTGQVSNNQIASVAAVKVSGQLTDAQLADIAATKVVGQLVSSQLADGAVTSNKFASNIEPVTLVSSVPTTKSTATIYNTADGKTYRWDGTKYTRAIPTVDLSGLITNAQIEEIAAAKVTGQLTGAQISDNAISTPKLAANAVTTAKVAAGAITADEIASNAVTAVKIAAGSVTTDKMTANSINGDRIAANTLDAAKIKAGTVLAGNVIVSGTNQPLSTAHSSSTWDGTSGKPDDTDLLNSFTEGSITSIAQPKGGTFFQSTSGVQGSIKIRLPQSWTHTMLRFFVEVYNYRSDSSFTLEVGGYTYGASSTWINTYARMTGSSSAEVPVYFGHDGTKCCVYIGTPTSTWAYPQVSVTDVKVGYSNNSVSMWNAGWEISISATGPQNVKATFNNPLTGASWSEVTGTGRPEDNATVGAPNGTNVGNQSAANVAAWSEDPAARVNANTTTIHGGKITTNSITANQIAANAITASELAANSVSATNIVAGSITGDRLAANTITAGQIAAGAIGVSELAAGAVTTESLSVQTKTLAGINLCDDQGLWGTASFATSPSGWSWNNSAANAWYTGSSPSGGSERIMRMVGTTTSGGNGGWNIEVYSSNGYDPKNTYRYYTWMYAQDTNGTLYLGTGRVSDVGSTTQVGNPYFFSFDKGDSRFSRGKWYLAVGIIHGSGYNAGQSGLSGLYDPVSGEKVIPGSDYQSLSTNTQLTVRSYQYYGSSTGGTAYFTKPVLEEVVSGKTVSIQSLLQGLDFASAVNVGSTTINGGKITTRSITASQIATNSLTANEIAANSITASELAADAVTAAAIKAGTITSNEIAVNSIWGSRIQAGTITGDRLAANTITAGQIAANSITGSELAADAVTAGHIVAGAISTSELATGAVTAVKIAANSITADRIATNAITANELASNAVLATNIASNAVTADKIYAGSITAAKLASSNVVTSSAQIANGIIDNAKIANATITSLKVQDLTIGTEKLSLNAITRSYYVQNTADVTIPWGGVSTVLTLVVNQTMAESVIHLFANINVRSDYEGDISGVVTILRDGTWLNATPIGLDSEDNVVQVPVPIVFMDTTASVGSHTYTVTLRSTGRVLLAQSGSALQADERKR